MNRVYLMVETTKEQKDVWKVDADKAGKNLGVKLSLSAWVRMILNRECGK